MLQLQEICKEYHTGTLAQKALDHINLCLRDSEFVAVLGPSGSGKTTLLNVIGGLDSYDSGDLLINGVSTKQYKDRDWDAYRNHTVGFVFQSYNLIPHQTVLANVELTLTVSGIMKAERTRRAREALIKVGLGEHIHKLPGQLSGGQMQRVAIARALVNDPDILLADEPTGALDSETSIQVMDLLRQVARDRLVVMVTHNPELAEKYATRIVRLKDGKILSDSSPCRPAETGEADQETVIQKFARTSMSFLTALSLSFNNLRTKKARTLLTSVAGSIGIIGIALILAVSNGANTYIDMMQEETLAEYPVQIRSTGLDLGSVLSIGTSRTNAEQPEGREVGVFDFLKELVSSTGANDLSSLKQYLDSGNSGMEQYANAVEYLYDIEPLIYKQNGSGNRQVNPDETFKSLGFGSGSSSNTLISSMMSTNVFYQMPEDASLYQTQYDVKAGHWPENYDECVIVLTPDGCMSDFMLYVLDLRDPLKLDEMIQEFIDEVPVVMPDDYGDYSYDDLLGIQFKLVNRTDCYVYDDQYQIWTDKTDDESYMDALIDKGEDLTVVGVVQPSQNGNGFALFPGINYPAALTEHVAEQAAESKIVQDQLANPDSNIFTGETFGENGSQDVFDLNSLFTVDTEALADLFRVDEDALAEKMSQSLDLSGAFRQAGDSLDLSGLVDLGNIHLDLPDMPSLDLEDLLGNLELDISGDSLVQIAKDLLEGYQSYAASHPEADFSGLREDLLSYFQTDEARGILEQHIRSALDSNGKNPVSADELRDLFGRILSGYQEYAADNGYTDGDLFGEYLMEYLHTEEAETVMKQWAADVFPSEEFQISSEQLESLASDLYDGYLAYAAASGRPDPGRIGDYFADYLKTDPAQELLVASLMDMVDTESLEQQISDALNNAMSSAMRMYGAELEQALNTQIRSALEQVMDQAAAGIEAAMSRAFRELGEQLESSMNIDAEDFADAFHFNMDGKQLSELLLSMSAAQSASLESNLRNLGYADFDKPVEIDIYPRDFSGKNGIIRILDDYNNRMEADKKDDQTISYTDTMGPMINTVTQMINTISYVLIAFVAISLVVSSIMIGVITYISVLERRKEIGILRAIGASKRNVSQVFNAETFIIGAFSGVLGIGVALLLLPPVNALIHHFAGTGDMNGKLPVFGALLLILLSIVLTLISGLIPARKAAKSNPVAALREA